VRRTNSLPRSSWLGGAKRGPSGVVRRVGLPLSVLLATVFISAALNAAQAVSKTQLSAAHKAWLDEEAVPSRSPAIRRAEKGFRAGRHGSPGAP